jgi:hypothetical protein
MKNIFLLLIVLCSLPVITGCQTAVKPQKTSLELQAIQAREFDTDKKTAFNSTMSVFQDLGYIVNSASFETGFITAQSPVKTGTELWGMHVPDGIMKSTKATAFVEEIRPGHTKVRLNFVNMVEQSQDQGQRITEDTAVEQPEAYQNAFTKIQEAIFIRTAIK